MEFKCYICWSRKNDKELYICAESDYMALEVASTVMKIPKWDIYYDITKASDVVNLLTQDKTVYRRCYIDTSIHAFSDKVQMYSLSGYPIKEYLTRQEKLERIDL